MDFDVLVLVERLNKFHYTSMGEALLSAQGPRPQDNYFVCLSQFTIYMHDIFYKLWDLHVLGKKYKRHVTHDPFFASKVWLKFLGNDLREKMQEIDIVSRETA